MAVLSAAGTRPASAAPAGSGLQRWRAGAVTTAAGGSTVAERKLPALSMAPRAALQVPNSHRVPNRRPIWRVLLRLRRQLRRREAQPYPARRRRVREWCRRVVVSRRQTVPTARSPPRSRQTLAGQHCARLVAKSLPQIRRQTSPLQIGRKPTCRPPSTCRRRTPTHPSIGQSGPSCHCRTEAPASRRHANRSPRMPSPP